MTEQQDMRRIAIVGATGSGKSTLAHMLAARRGLPFHDLDDLYWRPGWQPAPQEAFLEAVREAAAGERWIFTGNYRVTRPLIWSRADTVIWLDYSFARVFRQLLRRSIRRMCDRKPICNGNYESLCLFFSRHSIMLWLFRTFRARRREYGAAMRGGEYPHIRFIRLGSPAETRAFLAGLE